MNAFSDFPIFGTGGSASSGSCGLSAVKLMIYLIGEIIKAELRLRKGIILGMIFEESFGSSWFPNDDRSPFRLVCLAALPRSRSKSPCSCAITPSISRHAGPPPRSAPRRTRPANRSRPRRILHRAGSCRWRPSSFVRLTFQPRRPRRSPNRITHTHEQHHPV